jgi:hypothetical protein
LPRGKRDLLNIITKANNSYIHSFIHAYIHTYTHIHIYADIYPPPGGHLGPCGPEPSREAPNGLHRAYWKPSGAVWAPIGPGGPKLHPQSLLEAIWGLVGSNRAGRPQTASTEPPESHLGSCGLQPGREAPNGFHRASWRPPGALWAPAGPGGPERLIVILVNSLARCNFNQLLYKAVETAQRCVVFQV